MTIKSIFNTASNSWSSIDKYNTKDSYLENI